MRKTKLEEMVARHEGFRSRPYRCTAGKLTIGYGINLENGISEMEAHILLRMRLETIVVALNDRLSWFVDIGEDRQNVLADMAYQLGITGLMKFKKFLALCEQKEWTEASKEMLRSKWATEDTPGRANELSQIIKSGGF